MKDKINSKEQKDFSLGKRMALVIIASIIAGEVLIMLIIHSLQVKSVWMEASVDSLLLTILILPAIHFFVVRPLTIQANKRQQTEEKLRESEKQYRTLFERSNDAIFVVDKSTGNYLDANKAAEILTGRSLDELKKLKTSELSPTDAGKRLERIKDTNETLALGEVEYLRPDGTIRNALLSSIPLGNDSVYGIARDITERKKVGKALRESEELYRSLFENMLNGFAYCQMHFDDNDRPLDFTYLTVNSAFETQTGLKNVVGKKVTEVSPGIRESDPELLEIYGRVSNTGKAERFEMFVVSRQDWFSVSVYSPGSGTFVAVFDVITERKQAEEARRKSEVHLQTLVQTVPDLIWLKDPSGIYLSCNTMFERLVGVKVDEIFGKTDYDLFSRENADFFRENDRKAIAAGKPTGNEEWINFADDGHRALLDVIKTPMFDSTGTLIGVLGIGHDITERKRMEEALKDSEDKFSKAFLLSPYAITISSAKDGKFIEVNDAFMTLSGFTREEALGRTSVDLDFWADIEDRNWVISALFEGREVTGKEFQFKKRNGETGTGLFSAQVIHLNNEPFILSSINDITYRKQGEKALRDSEEKYRFLFANNPQPMWIFDLETLAFLEVNQAAIDHYGYSRDEFMSMTLKDIRPAKDIPTLQKEIQLEVNSSNPIGEWRHIMKNGELIIVEITAHSVTYNGRKARHVLVNDITERKKAEELLRESRETFRLYIENSFDVIFTLDHEGTFDFISPAWERHFGFPISEAIGRSFVPFVHPDDVVPLFEYLNHIFITGKNETSPAYRVRHINGNWLWFISNGAPYFDAKGNPRFIGVGHDITEERRTISEIKNKNEQLVRAHAEKDKFFSIIAHDLRNPFSSFLGLTQIMAEDLPSLTMGQVQEIAQSMSKSAANLYRLLENLLQWAQIQQGLIPINPEVLSLISVVNECIAISLEPAKNKGIELFSKIQDDIKIFADDNALQSIIRNVVSNAMKFTPSGGKIIISAKTRNDKSIEISISDTGIGMSAELVGNLFRPDVQTSRKGTDGEPSSGLGLLLCKDFVERQGGKIWAKSVVGKGSTFSFTLPQTPEQIIKK